MSASEGDRRRAVVIHAALIACLGAYGVLLVFFRTLIRQGPVSPPPERLFLVLALIGATQFAVVSATGRRLLASPRGKTGERVRVYFLVRGAAAEALGLFGFLLGLRGAPAPQPAALIAIALVAMLSCAPTRRAWERAVRLTESRAP